MTTLSRKKSVSKYCTVPKSFKNCTASLICKKNKHSYINNCLKYDFSYKHLFHKVEVQYNNNKEYLHTSYFDSKFIRFTGVISL